MCTFTAPLCHPEGCRVLFSFQWKLRLSHNKKSLREEIWKKPSKMMNRPERWKSCFNIAPTEQTQFPCTVKQGRHTEDPGDNLKNTDYFLFPPMNISNSNSFPHWHSSTWLYLDKIPTLSRMLRAPLSCHICSFNPYLKDFTSRTCMFHSWRQVTVIPMHTAIL